mgnify:CR=1 FL=1
MHRALAGLVLACAAATAAAAPLAVCVDADDAPFSSAATPERGIDVGVAQALAERLERPLKLVWVTVPNRGGLGKALRQTLVAGECDAYLGIPLGPDMARELAERQLAATGAYLGLGYLWVAAPGQPAPSAATLRAARKVDRALDRALRARQQLCVPLLERGLRLPLRGQESLLRANREGRG